MKQEVNPVVVAVIVIVVAAVAFFFVWHKAGGSAGSVPPGGVGHAGPFSPGGQLAGTGKGAKPANAAQPGGNPGGPR